MKKPKDQQRKAFNFLLSYYDVYKRLPDPQSKEQFITAICEKQFFGIEPDLSGMEEFAYASQKHSLDKSRMGWEDVQKRETITIPSVGPSVGPSEGGSKGPSVQEKEKEKEKESIEVRKNKFYASLSDYVSEYPKQMLRDFFDYWTEHGVKDTKMRFEKEKTFGISQRLKTWYNRNPKQYDESTIVDPLVEYVYKKTGLR